MPEDLFPAFESFTEGVLVGIAAHERAALKYKATLGLITQVLLTTHAMVVERLERLEDAKSVEEAHSILEELNWEPLTESFRLEGLCDAFEGLGIALHNLITRPETADAFASYDLQAVSDMADALANRESEVVVLYLVRIQDLADLVNGKKDDLGEIIRQARQAKAVLTQQVSDFHSKSRRFLTATT
jgi:hypothetical protein